MANLHVDLYNGNDANDGSTWALAKKTVSSITAAHEDTIKIAKTAITNIGNADWVKNTSNVTLASAKTLEIARSDGNSWTAVSPSVSGTYSYRKIGSSAERITCNKDQTGKIAYLTLPTAVDLSAFTKLSFWLRYDRYNYYEQGDYVIHLCSDTIGDVPVHSFNLNSAFDKYTSNLFYAFVFDNITALGSSIASISITKTSVSGYQVYLYINHILACNDLTLQSLIGVGNTNKDLIYSIQSIDGVNIVLDKELSTSVPNTATKFIGDTDTYTTYVSNGIAKADITWEFGAEDALINIVGGYNTTTDEVDGCTHIFSQYDGAVNVSKGNYNYYNFIFSHQHVMNSSTATVKTQVRFIDTVFVGFMYGTIGNSTYPDGKGFVNCIIANTPTVEFVRQTNKDRPRFSYVNGLQIINVTGSYALIIGQDGGIYKNISFKGYITFGLTITGAFNLIDTVTFDSSSSISDIGYNNTIRNCGGSVGYYSGYDAKVYDPPGTIPTGSVVMANYGASFIMSDNSVIRMFSNPVTNASLDLSITLPDGTEGAWQVAQAYYPLHNEMLHGIKVCEAYVEENKFIVARLFFRTKNTTGDVHFQFRAMADNCYGVIDEDVINEITISSETWVEHSISFVTLAKGLVVIDVNPLDYTFVFGQFSITAADI